MSHEFLIEISYDFDAWCASFYYIDLFSVQLSTCGWGLGHEDLILTDEMLLEIMKGLEEG